MSKMEHFIVVITFFFIIRVSNFYTVDGKQIDPELQHYLNREFRRVEEACDNKLNKMREEIRNEKILLKRENSLLKVKLYKERQKGFKELLTLRKQYQTAKQQSLEKFRSFEDQMLEKMLGNKETDVLSIDDKEIEADLENTSSSMSTKQNESRESEARGVVRRKGQRTHITCLDHIDGNKCELKYQRLNEVDTPEDEQGNANKRMLNPATPTRVAFFARLTNQTTPYLDANQDIVFNNVVTNIGNGYHGNHGLFVAPVPGVYVFSTTLVSFLASPGQTKHAKLVKNGQLLARLEQSDVNGWDTSSLTLVVEMQKGDDVAIQTSGDMHQVTYTGDNYSMFSGFLLYENLNSPSLVGK